jgi:predicted nuclease of predicted toxin-antitoxin system
LTKKKSKKPSASNSAASPEPITLFVDRCAWSRLLGEALDEIGANYIAHHQRFAPAAPDEEWLAVAGQEAWIVLTRDKRIRRRPAELDAFREHKVIVFVLAAGNASAAETAELVSRLYKKILRLAKQAQPPVMYSLTRSGISKPFKFK